MSLSERCRVCLAPAPVPFQHVEGRDYWRCPRCEATFVDAAQLPDAASEEREYRLHENAVFDLGYRRFLGKVFRAVQGSVPTASSGLDYGCGPGPALAAMLREAGHQMAVYDPLFADEPAVLERRYAFVTCTEVIEHFHAPAAAFDRLFSLVEDGGLLAVMTCFQTDDARFAHWHYRRDPTHVAFYREKTLHTLAADRGWACQIPEKDVALFTRLDHLT